MTDQDNLRDRISTVMWSATISDGRRAAMVPDCKAMAQAIIDEFGLTVETEPGHDPRECGCSSRAYPAESRIVGKWVEQ